MATRNREKLRRVLAKRGHSQSVKRKERVRTTLDTMHISPASGDGSKIEYLGESKTKFTYPCGHTKTKNWGNGPISKQIPPESVRWLTAMWNRNGEYTRICLTCFRKGIDKRAQTAVARQNVKERASRI